MQNFPEFPMPRSFILPAPGLYQQTIRQDQITAFLPTQGLIPLPTFLTPIYGHCATVPHYWKPEAYEQRPTCDYSSNQEPATATDITSSHETANHSPALATSPLLASSPVNPKMDDKGAQSVCMASKQPSTSEIHAAEMKEEVQRTPWKREAPTHQTGTDKTPSASPWITTTPAPTASESTASQLRMPPVRYLTDVTADLMEEENDLGYFSFLDVSPEPTLERQGKTELSEIIDDVLDTMDQFVPESEGVNNFSPSPIPYSSHQPPQTHTQLLKNVPAAETKPQRDTRFAVQQFNPQATPNFEVQRRTSIAVNRELFCTLCRRQFHNKTDFNIHVKMHSDERPHQCPCCEKSFGHKAYLRTHIRTHTGERPYRCTACPKAFSDYSTYKKHLRIHSGEKPYVCDVCFKGFTQSGNMIRHRKTHSKTS